MNLTQLKAAGGIVGGAMVKKSVVWKHEDAKGKPVTDKFSIFVMPQSFGMIEKLFSATEPEDSRNAKYIATCVTLGENGEEPISYEDAFRLAPGLGWAILAAVHAVNNTGADRAKKLTAADEFWHELVLNGVGGRTVAEAKANISYPEAMAWAAYRNKHGSFNLAARAEQMGAIVALQVNRMGGGKAELIDFMPHQEKAGVSLETAMAEWV